MARGIPEIKVIVIALVVRVSLLTLSLIGWLLYLIAWGLIYDWILNGVGGDVRGALEYFFPEYKQVLIPFWLFMILPLPLYLVNIAHMLLPAVQWKAEQNGQLKKAHRITNSAHVIHTIINLMEMWYYMSAAVVIIMVAIVIAINKYDKQAEGVETAFQFNHYHLRLMGGGAIMAVIFYWLSITWPLFSLRRKRVSDYQELEETINQ